MHISKADIDDLKARVDIVEFISSVMPLKKQGRSFVGRCIFIPEKTASFTVNPETQLYNCFSCRAQVGDKTGVMAKSGGDVITFVMKWKGLTFPEAYAYLGGRTPSGESPAVRARKEARPLDWKPTDREGAPVTIELGRAPRTRLIGAAFHNWQQNLATTPRAQEMLESRGLTTRAIWRALGLGYSSGSLEDLCGTEASAARGHYIDMGIFYKTDSESVRETMRGRIVIPFVAFNQLPVGVYGRSVSDDLEPHHRLTRGERGGNINGNAARGHQEISFVEAPFDAHSMIEMGFQNSVPLCGSVLLADHEELVRRFEVKSVVVGLDSDETGRKAAPIVAEQLRKMGVLVRIVEWPAKDPNELLVKHGAKKAREIVDALLRAPKACDKAACRGALGPEGVAHEDARVTVDAVSISPLTDVVASPEEAALFDATVSASVRGGNISGETTHDPNNSSGAISKGDRGGPGGGEQRPSGSGGNISGEGGAVATAPELPTVEPVSRAAPEADEPQAPKDSALPVTPATHEVEAPTLPATSPSTATLSDDELRSRTLTVRYEDRRYGLTWLESPSVAQLRAHTRLELLPEAADDGVLPLVTFLDSINLASGRSRESFIRHTLQLVSPASEKLLAPKDALMRLVEADLMRLYELGERRMKALCVPKATTNVMTDERRERALSYLLAPDLLARLSADLDALGYVGERRAKLLGYLVSISRKLPEALSMVILSASGSGKSALAEVLERLTPEEDLLVVSRFTAASLYWMEKDAMKRKFVSIEERGGSEEADYAIRALQSKKQLTMMAPIKDQASGKLETKFFFVEGPTAFLESTTESQINHENATRCFEERLDESREQTRRIHESQRFSKTPEGQRRKVRAEEIAALHRDVQRCLRVVKVSIPYADLLTFPSTWTRNRRDHPRFLNLIEVIAFLHQYQRPLRYLDTDEPCERAPSDLTDEELAAVYVEASVEDYGSAKTLYAEILSETLAELKRPLRELLSVFEKLVAEKKARGHENAFLLVRELRDATRLEQRVIRRYLAELVELEHLTQTRGPNGAANAYRLAELESRPAAEIEGLLSVEEVRRRIEERRRQP